MIKYKFTKAQKILSELFPRSVLIGFIFLLLLLVVYFYARSYNNMLSEKAASYNQHIKSEIELRIDSVQKVLLAVALSYPDENNPEECDDLVSGIMAKSPDYSNIFVINRFGRIFCGDTFGKDISDRLYFKRALEKKDFASGGYIVGSKTGLTQLSLAYPVLDETGEVQQVIATGIRLDRLTESLKHFNLPQGLFVTLIDSNGTILFEEPGNGHVGIDFTDKRLLDRMIRNGSGIDSLKISGRNKIVNYSTAEDGSFHLLVGVDSRKSLSVFEVLVAKYWLTVLISYLVLLSIFFFFFLKNSWARRPSK